MGELGETCHSDEVKCGEDALALVSEVTENIRPAQTRSGDEMYLTPVGGMAGC